MSSCYWLIVRSGTNEEWKCASSKTFPPSPMHRIQVRKSPELGSQELFVLPRPSSCLHLCLALRDLHILHVACALSAPLSLNNLTKRNCDAANEGCAPHKPPSACKGLQKEENANKLEGKKDVSSWFIAGETEAELECWSGTQSCTFATGPFFFPSCRHGKGGQRSPGCPRCVLLCCGCCHHGSQ